MEWKPVHGKRRGVIRQVNAPRVNWMASRLFAALLLVVTPLTAVAEAQHNPQQLYAVDLPPQTIAESLNQLARQTGAQFLFPFQLAQSKAARPVKGRFTLLQATQYLLHNTGLTSDLVDGVLTISPIYCQQGETICDPNNLYGHTDESTKGKRMNIKNSTKRKTLLAGLVGLFAAGGTAQVAAQGGEAATSQSAIDEIIVTATKRETSLQDTALSVSAISGADIAKLGISSFTDVIATVPGVSVNDLGPGSRGITFRGIAASSVGNITTNATTSFYLDEFPLVAGSFDSDVKLVDMAQLEVLKGPQGTLYGKSALGGVVRYITNKPSTDAITGGFDLTSEHLARGGSGYQGQGYINVPLSDTVAIRGVFYNYDNAGFIDNLGTNTKNANTEEVTGGRLALRWNVSDRTTFDLQYLRQTSLICCEQGNGLQSASSTYTPVEDGTPTDISAPDLSNPSLYASINPTHDRASEAINAKLNISFDQFDLSLMATSKDRHIDIKRDLSVWFGMYGDLATALGDYDFDYEASTFEARMVSTGDGPIQWIAGLWYEKEDNNFAFPIQINTSRTDFVLFGTPTVDGDFLLDRESFEANKELSAYGEIGYRFNEQAKLTLGYRRANLKLDSGSLRGDGRFDTGEADAIGADETSDEDVNTYKINFEYTVNEDVLIYALASSGYRSGGFNRGGVITAASSYGSDTLWNYEVGARTSWMDNRVIANVVAYYVDWSDIQLRAYDPDSFSDRIQNVAEAEVYGLETEIRYQVSENFSLSMNYGYIDGSLAADFLDISTDPATVVAEKGATLPGSSKDTFSLLADWQTSLTNDLNLNISGSYIYTGLQAAVLGSAQALVAEGSEIPSFELVNLSMGLTHSNGVQVSLFAKNLLDEKHKGITFGRDFLETNALIRPRTLGVNVGYSF